MRGIRFAADQAPVAPVELDASQRRVVDLDAAASAAVIGAPGSGKTTVLLELLAARVDDGLSADALLVLTPSRLTATRLRDAVALRLGVATDGPRVRTVPSLAFELVTAAARREGAPPPRLITGGDQDADIAETLDGAPPAIHWPDELGPHVRALRSFRSELREVLARITERGMTPADLTALGVRVGRPEWEAAGGFLAHHLDVIAESRSDQFDAAELVRFAIRAIENGTAGPRIDALRLVLVDDLQEATESTLALLRALAARGIPIVAFGEPDVAANAFRGGDPGALGRLSAELGVPVEAIVLEGVHRHGPAIRALVSAAVGRVGAASAGSQRAAASVAQEERDAIERITALSPARESAAIARRLREAHLLHDVPWNRMLVVVRSGARVPALARVLALADVPTRVGSGGVALRDDPSARALLKVVEVATGRRALDPETAEELLAGPFGGLDPLELRHLRRALRAEEVAGDGVRPAGELVADALAAPDRLVTIDSRWARKATRLADTLAAIRASAEAEPPGSIEDLLWLAWDRSALAAPWREQALGGGIGASEANRRLDAIVALFTAAKRFAERRPDAPAEEFLAEVLDAEVPEDILLPRPVDEAVLVTTPSGTVGLEADLVVVAGLQQGVWPNMRPRGTLLHPQRIAAAASGIEGEVDERKAVLDDELRMFALAVSRSTSRVVLSAVANDDDQPSPLLRLGAPSGAEPTRVEEQDPDGTGRGLPLSLRGTVGGLRRIAVSGRDPRRRVAAAETLALLAREEIPGADPRDWLGVVPTSTDRPLYDGVAVPVSPSRVDRLEESPLDWFLDEIAGGDPGVTANIGTILHSVMETVAMETADDPRLDRVWSVVESRWGELVFDAPWLEERQKRLTRVLAEGLSAYLTGFAASGKQLVGAERRFLLKLDGAGGGQVEIRGSIDRVERDADGAVVIVDLKTGNPISAKKIAEHPQLGAYQLAYAEGVLDAALAEAFPDEPHSSGGATLVYVKSGRKNEQFQVMAQEVLDDERLDAVRERLRKAATLIAATGFEGVLDVPDLGPIDRSSFRLHRTFDVTSDGIEQA